MVSIIELFPSLCLLYLCSDRLAYEKTSVCIIMYGLVYIFQPEADRISFGIENTESDLYQHRFTLRTILEPLSRYQTLITSLI